MGDKQEYSVILSTCGNRDEAEKLARSLVENHLAACVQLTGVTSFYEWEQKLNRDEEILLLIKTRTASYARIEEFISRHHSYEVPEVVQLPIQQGLARYLKWIDEGTA